MTVRRRRKTGRGTLAVIAVLLIGSALVRAGLGAGSALARAEEFAATEAAASTPPVCEPPKEIAAVLAALDERETRLTQREGQMRDRMRALATAEEELSRKTEELVAAEEALRATIALADSAAEDDITRLVAVYQAMKPKEAAALFETMAPEFAAGFMGRMEPQAAAGIMAGLNPQTAYSVSVILAGRNASVPKE
ncbi:MotE family protein [Lacimonas salitolerans]|uniref:MotE family protein n=1 Tax=Lacimonas salitolerans TaxID=1323750 RepID=A0ABW4EHQ1_9RHOB